MVLFRILNRIHTYVPIFLFSQTLFAAYHSGALQAKYLVETLDKLDNQMAEIESQLAPPGWKAIFDRYDALLFSFFSMTFFVKTTKT